MRTYAVVVDGNLRGAYTGNPSSGMVSLAGAVTRDGAPVNRVGAQLSTDSQLIEEAEERMLPVFTLREYNGFEFITCWYDEDHGGYFD